MSTSYTRARPAPLTGDDARLDHLINVEGINQLTACKMLWAPELLADPSRVVEPPASAPLDVQLAWARARAGEIVRTGLADVLAWLRGAA